jgi:hypothetical protein
LQDPIDVPAVDGDENHYGVLVRSTRVVDAAMRDYDLVPSGLAIRVFPDWRDHLPITGTAQAWLDNNTRQNDTLLIFVESQCAGTTCSWSSPTPTCRKASS